MPRLPRWLDESNRLRSLGDIEGANRVLVAAGKQGSLEAAATLARYLWAGPNTGSSVAILEEVERRVRPNDWKTHFAIHLAYAIGVPSDVEQHTEFQRRAFEHLKAAAKASSDARMYYSVGLHYWQGLNMVPKDVERARAWLEVATSSGDPEIVQSYRRFNRQHPAARLTSAA